MSQRSKIDEHITDMFTRRRTIASQRTRLSELENERQRLVHELHDHEADLEVLQKEQEMLELQERVEKAKKQLKRQRALLAEQRAKTSPASSGFSRGRAENANGRPERTHTVSIKLEPSEEI